MLSQHAFTLSCRPDAWCLSMHLSCHTWCMLSPHAFLLACRPDACCRSMHLSCHVTTLTFAILLHLEKWLFFNCDIFWNFLADLCSEPWWKFSEFYTFYERKLKYIPNCYWYRGLKVMVLIEHTILTVQLIVYLIIVQ